MVANIIPAPETKYADLPKINPKITSKIAKTAPVKIKLIPFSHLKILLLYRFF